jgi:hypothetical protein
VLEGLGDDRGHLAGVLVGRRVAHVGEGGVDPVAPEAEVALRLLADEDQRVVDAVGPPVLHLALGGADHRGVVRPGQPPVGGDDDVGDLADGLRRPQQGVVAPGPGLGEVLDDGRDLLGVGAGSSGALLGLDHPGGGDQLHRPGDLLRRLDALDAPPKDPLLPARHR